MGYPRNRTYREGDAGMYHCTVRCVRQSFLIGEDPVTKINYDHRKEWIRDRLAFLISIFAIEVVAYAIMSNHLHSVLRTAPLLVDSWNEREVAERWVALYPPKSGDTVAREMKINRLLSSPARIKVIRQRLCSISWFNKLLNEHISKRANAEDQRSGHFWEGRFYSQKVLDIPGAIACSVYVDLNPIRANAAKTPETSEFTSVCDRIAEVNGQSLPVKLVSIEEAFKGRLSLADYLLLVDQTARVLVTGKAAMPADVRPILERLEISAESWMATAKDFKTIFQRVVGSKKSIDLEAERVKRRLRGFSGTNLLATW